MINTVVVDSNKQPLIVYRGEYGYPWTGNNVVGSHSRLASYTFSTVEVANHYALVPNTPTDVIECPRVIPAYLHITNPFINNPNDPYLDLSVVYEKLGEKNVRRIALKFVKHISDTNHWYDILQGLPGVISDYIRTASLEQLMELSFQAWHLLDDHQEIQLLKLMGYDGAITGGSGASAMKPEYRVFSQTQIFPTLLFSKPPHPRSLPCRKTFPS